MIVVGVFLLALNIINEKYMNTKELPLQKSLVTKQSILENKFKLGKSINKPNIILDPYKISPLTALVLFKTKTEVKPKVTIIGKDKLSTYSTTFDKSKEHYLPIYGLYPDKENEVLIEYKENNKRVTKTIKIKTDKLPNDFIKPTSVVSKKEKLTNDLYFFTPSSKGYTCAYDINGDVRWYLSSYALWDNTRLKNELDI